MITNKSQYLIQQIGLGYVMLDIRVTNPILKHLALLNVLPKKKGSFQVLWVLTLDFGLELDNS